MNNDFDMQQLPPQSIEAEEAVLGSIFLDNEAIIAAMNFLEADDFYKHANQIIFQILEDLADADRPIDLVTVRESLENKNLLEETGGALYLSTLANNTPTAKNVEYYAKIVAEKAKTRRLILAANDIVKESFKQDLSGTDLLDYADKKIQDVSENNSLNGFKPMEQVLTETVDEINERSKEDSNITGLSTGYKELDNITSGLHEDELVILAARPGVGKTAFALNVAQNIATKTDETVAIFSLEMGATSLVSRMICAEGSIDSGNLRSGQLTDEEWRKLTVSVQNLKSADIYLDDTPGLKISQIRAQLMKLVKEKGQLGLVVIDYLQLIEGSGRENRQQEVSEISRQLKKIAKELKVPVIALSQLSRGVEQRQNKRPILSDIRESGSIEQDADIVAFLYREDYYHDEEDGDEYDDEERYNEEQNDDVGEVEIIIEKNRAGARGTVKLMFMKQFNKFSSIAYNYE